MRVLVVGSGGREHALCWALAASPLCDKLFCAPGNAGIAHEAECVPIGPEDTARLVAFAKEFRLDFVVIGPEGPLVAGLADRLEESGIAAFGPSAAAAALEGSKGFMKDLARECAIPSAAYGRFRDAEQARQFVRAHGAPIVVKADGLAAGKGVCVAETVEDALKAVDEALVARRFGAAGAEIVIEEYLEGEEASFFALVDGRNAIALGAAQDHKRVGEGDTGPNTGGMGAYSPAPVITPEVAEQTMERIVRPAVAGLANSGRPFKGVLFAGLMVTPSGPKLLEFNVRFGDPECEVLMVRLKSDLLAALIAAREGELRHFDLRWHDHAALCVVMAARGYPGEYRSRTEIRGLERAETVPGVTIFHAGTAHEDGRWLATGGRALAITATGATLAEARAASYRAIDLIDWPEGFCRRDIGWRALGSNRARAGR